MRGSKLDQTYRNMQIILLFFFPACVLTLSSAWISVSVQADVLKPRKVLSGKGSMLLPQDFVLMDARSIAKKYPTAGHRPTEVYTNPGGTINVALNHTRNVAKESDLEGVKQVMDAQFNRPSIDFIGSEIRDVNGKKFIILEFVSQAVDTKIYNLMAIGSLDGRLVMITFNCTDNFMKDWQPVAKKIIGSIIVA